ncbi:hypothetical protein BOVATA_032030 [Babesia ovata]|uniref:Uncharacterized protein n=1 Tax=Babesia ovata TaxID=189622 RepID=A0A2H6KFE0_9APIC|nr:uncharacterized protein BOVATA_032030 [Babesia ovata]GBE61710.1 hypothetical protein BOVATA_032030 [Babesia ovata]
MSRWDDFIVGYLWLVSYWWRVAWRLLVAHETVGGDGLEVTLDLTELTVKCGHFVLQFDCLWITTSANFPSRLPNRRLSRSPDLRLSLLVEIVNGVGKIIYRFLKIMFDSSEFAFKPLNLIPHVLQLTVHGLGGAILLSAGWFRDLCRLFQLLVEIIYSRFNSVQDFAKLVGT